VGSIRLGVGDRREREREMEGGRQEGLFFDDLNTTHFSYLIGSFGIEGGRSHGGEGGVGGSSIWRGEGEREGGCFALRLPSALRAFSTVCRKESLHQSLLDYYKGN